jgi:hypothetical protein
MGRSVWWPDSQPGWSCSSSALATWLLTFAETYPRVPSGGARDLVLAGGSFSVSITYVSKVLPGRERQGCCTWHRRGGKCRRRCDQVRRASMVMAAIGWKGVANVWAHRARCRCGCDFLLHSPRMIPTWRRAALSGERKPTQFCLPSSNLCATSRSGGFHSTISSCSVRSWHWLALAPALPDRRIRFRHKDGRHAGGGLFGSCIPVPHLRRPPVG